MTTANRIIGNLILVAIIAYLFDVIMPWSIFDMQVADLVILVSASSFGWMISLTCGWANFWMITIDCMINSWWIWL